jgi:lysozyme
VGLRGIDVSTYQGDVDWAAVKASGISFVYAKASEGQSYVDDRFNDNHDDCGKIGLALGAYHFFHFGIDPVAQANHFIATTKDRVGNLRPVVDVEGGGQDGVTDLPTLVKNLAAFNDTVEDVLGPLVIYTDYGDWNGFMQGTDAFSGHTLWIAEYNNQAAPSLPNGFKDWVAWQHADNGSVPGIAGNVDLNVTKANDLSGLLRS